MSEPIVFRVPEERPPFSEGDLVKYDTLMADGTHQVGWAIVTKRYPDGSFDVLGSPSS